MQCIGVVYIETQRDIHQCATDELVNAGMDGIHLRYMHLIAVTLQCLYW